MKKVFACFTKHNGKEIFSFYTESGKEATTWRMQDRENRGIHTELVGDAAVVSRTTIIDGEPIDADADADADAEIE